MFALGVLTVGNWMKAWWMTSSSMRCCASHSSNGPNSAPGILTSMACRNKVETMLLANAYLTPLSRLTRPHEQHGTNHTSWRFEITSSWL